jgi:hypothetical protein
MYQDIKNFYNLTDIDITSRLLVQIQLRLHDDAKYKFTVNSQLVGDSICVDLLDPLHFKCHITTGAVEIVKITINEHEVMPIYLHVSEPATNWVTESWQLHIPGPFYPWYHQITGQGWIA